MTEHEMYASGAHGDELVTRSWAAVAAATEVTPQGGGMSVFARIGHASANRDWMPCLGPDTSLATTTSTKTCPPVSPPTPIAMSETTNAATSTTTTTAAATTTTTVPALSFLSRFYRGGAAGNGSASVGHSNSSSTLATKAMRPAAVLPVDACLPVDAGWSSHECRSATGTSAAAHGAVEPVTTMTATLHMPQPIGVELTLPTAVGPGETWSALGSLPTAVPVPRPIAPSSIDAAPVTFTAPKPLWSELPSAAMTATAAAAKTSGYRSRNALSVLRTAKSFEAPTLDAFRAPVLTDDALPEAAAAACPCRVDEATQQHHAPLPPQPISISPLRDAETTHMAAPPKPISPLLPQTLPLRPIDDVVNDAPITPQACHREQSEAAALGHTAVAPQQPWLHEREAQCAETAITNNLLRRREQPEGVAAMTADVSDEVPMLALEFTRHEAEVEATEAVSTTVGMTVATTAAAAPSPRSTTVKSFFSTLFGRDDEEATSGGNPLYLNALEMATNKAKKPAPPTDYSIFFNTSLFDEPEEDDADFSLDQLRDVLNSVLQTVKADDVAQAKTTSTGGGGGGSGVGGTGSGAGERAGAVRGETRQGRYPEYNSAFSTKSSEWARMPSAHGPLFN